MLPAYGSIFFNACIEIIGILLLLRTFTNNVHGHYQARLLRGASQLNLIKFSMAEASEKIGVIADNAIHTHFL